MFLLLPVLELHLLKFEQVKPSWTAATLFVPFENLRFGIIVDIKISDLYFCVDQFHSGGIMVVNLPLLCFKAKASQTFLFYFIQFNNFLLAQRNISDNSMILLEKNSAFYIYSLKCRCMATTHLFLPTINSQITHIATLGEKSSIEEF